MQSSNTCIDDGGCRDVATVSGNSIFCSFLSWYGKIHHICRNWPCLWCQITPVFIMYVITSQHLPSTPAGPAVAFPGTALRWFGFIIENYISYPPIFSILQQW